MPSRGYQVPSPGGFEPVYNKGQYFLPTASEAFATNMGSLKIGRTNSLGATNFSSFWELAVGGVVYDRTTSIEEWPRDLYCEPYVKGDGRSKGRVHLPTWLSHVPSYRLVPETTTGSLFGTGDPRMTWFMTNRTTANGPGIMYPNGVDVNGSFGYRNRTWAFNDLKGSTNRPDLWLDGGHAASPNGPSPKPGGFYKVTDVRWTTLTNRQAYTNQPCAFIADGPIRNITELGNIFDPIQYETAVPSTSANKQPTYPTNITTTSRTNWTQGGGNTLRIGRAEHQRFAFTNIYNEATAIPIPNMGMSSAALLDLFCLTNGTSPNGGPYSLGGGKINLNTAPAPVLRALAGGILLTNDPEQVPANYAIPPAMTEAFAQGVMRFRSKYPFLTPSHLSFIGTDSTWPNTNNWPTNAVFGNTNIITLDTTAPGNTFGGSTRINVNEWNDQAAEEWFSKIFALSSYQSHNFRIYVVAQLVATNSSGTNAIGPLAKKYYQIYARNTNNSGIAVTPNTGYINNTIYTWTPAINTIDIHKSAY
jgi:hypothetical protein